MIQDEGCKKEYENGKDISNRVYTGACNNKIYSRNIYKKGKGQQEMQNNYITHGSRLSPPGCSDCSM